MKRSLAHTFSRTVNAFPRGSPGEAASTIARRPNHPLGNTAADDFKLEADGRLVNRRQVANDFPQRITPRLPRSYGVAMNRAIPRALAAGERRNEVESGDRAPIAYNRITDTVE